MDTQTSTANISDEVLNLKSHLDKNGIKYSHITDLLGREKSWLTQLFAGRMELSPETKKQLENILGIIL